MRLLVFVFGLLLSVQSLRAADSRPIPVPPPLPTPPSPVVSFRELLNMTPAARAVELQKKSPKNRAIIEDRLKEFDALPKDQREVRLKLMVLRWELMSLIRLAPTNRVPAIKLIPEQDRL